MEGNQDRPLAGGAYSMRLTDQAGCQPAWNIRRGGMLVSNIIQAYVWPAYPLMHLSAGLKYRQRQAKSINTFQVFYPIQALVQQPFISRKHRAFSVGNKAKVYV